MRAISTTDHLRAMILACEALREAIEAVGPGGIPSGHLYAHVLGHMDLATYERVIGLLIEAKAITRGADHVLRACPGNQVMAVTR